MAITYVDSSEERPATSESSIELALPAGIQDDDLLIVQAQNMADSQAISLDEAGWTAVDNQTHSTQTVLNQYIWLKKASSESGTYTLSIASGSGRWIAFMHAYRGVHTSTPQDQTAVKATETEDSDTIDPAAIVTQTDGAFVLVMLNSQQSGAVAGETTLPSGYTRRHDYGVGDAVSFQQYGCMCDKEVSSAGSEDPGTWSGIDQSTANAPDNLCITMALRPAIGVTITAVASAEAWIDGDTGLVATGTGFV